MKLTQKQRLFADEYIKSGNATQAYIKAGYNVKTDGVAASAAIRMLRNVKVKSYIDAKMAEIESHKIADAKEVLEFYTRVLREEETEEVAMATKDDVLTVEKKPSMKDRLSAAKELMKRYPLNDPVVKAQLERIKAVTRNLDLRNKSLEDNGTDVEEAVDKLMNILEGNLKNGSESKQSTDS